MLSKNVGFIMSWLKKFWYLPLLGAVLILGGIRIASFLLTPTLRPLRKRVVTEAVATTSTDAAPTIKSNGVYDYKRMVNLIEQTQSLKKSFNEHFTGFASKRYKPVDLKRAKSLLSDLYREKVRLQHYVWALKVHYHGHIPEKRRQTMLYYQKVIDTCIADVEMILRKV